MALQKYLGRIVTRVRESRQPVARGRFFGQPAFAAKPKHGVCRECGCTDNHACPGGCYWVDASHTLCSQCAEAK